MEKPPTYEEAVAAFIGTSMPSESSLPPYSPHFDQYLIESGTITPASLPLDDRICESVSLPTFSADKRVPDVIVHHQGPQSMSSDQLKDVNIPSPAPVHVTSPSHQRTKGYNESHSSTAHHHQSNMSYSSDTFNDAHNVGVTQGSTAQNILQSSSTEIIARNNNSQNVGQSNATQNLAQNTTMQDVAPSNIIAHNVAQSNSMQNIAETSNLSPIKHVSGGIRRLSLDSCDVSGTPESSRCTNTFSLTPSLSTSLVNMTPMSSASPTLHINNADSSSHIPSVESSA